MSMKDHNLTDVDKFSLMMYYKRSVVRISLYLGMPLLCAIAINNFIKGNYVVALLSCAMLLIVVLLGYVIKGRVDEKSEYKIYSILFRLFNAAAGIALLYEIGFQSNFSRIGWCYIYPILIFFVAGVTEGMIWVFIFYGILAFFILNIDLQGITPFQIQELRSRFLISYFVICMLSLFLAHGFRHAQQRLFRHQRILKERTTEH
jgi:two-component system cell cycle sensor histidine kinase/response regulator CckA